MQKYFIGCEIKGEAAEYYAKITSELAKKFGIKNLSERVAPHLTLSPPFETNDLEGLERLLDITAKESKAILITIEGFGRFDEKDSTIFLEVKDNQELQEQAQKIAGILVDFGENRNSFFEKIKLHISIARYLNSEQMNKVWQYLNSLDQPRLAALFDNLTLFKYRTGGWDIEKSYGFVY